jgi:endonuclease YncB( thermonuclease family)
MPRTRVRATCEYVRDGDTFRTAGQRWIRLANVCTPEEGERGYTIAKRILQGLILHEAITYEQVGFSYGRIVAEVWVDGLHVNTYMRLQGYDCA